MLRQRRDEGAELLCFWARRIVGMIAVLPVLGLLTALSIVADGERLPIKIYTTGDGLAHNDVRRIVRDSRGFLWFCTFEGLSRFDGYSLATYSVEHGLASPVANDLLETRSGQYWIATGAGLCRFNPRGIPQRRSTNDTPESAAANAMFTVYYPGSDEESRNVLSLFEDSRGAIWCGTHGGLYRLDQQNPGLTFRFIDLGTPNYYKTNNHISSIIEDGRGVVWVGSSSGIYQLLPDGRAQRYGSERNGLPDNTIHSLLADREGRVWVSTRYGGLVRLVSDPNAASRVVARVYTEKDGLPTRWINQIFQASDGSLWAGSNNGLIRFIKTEDGDFRFRAFAQPHGLTYQEVQSLADDRNGNLWLGMTGGGVAKLASSGITAFTDADGFKSARAIFKDRAGDLFVVGGVDKFLINRYDQERFTPIQLSFPKGISFSWGWNQLVVEDRAGDWWVSTTGGLSRYPKASSFAQRGGTRLPKANYTKRDGLAGDTIVRVFEDSRGDIWVGTVDGPGLSRWDRATATFQTYTEKEGLPSLASFYPISFCEDRAGNIWIGFSVGGGLARYRDGHFIHFTLANHLGEGGIFNLFIDSAGRLWIPTTRGGVGRIDEPSSEHPTIFTYTTEQGLSSNDVQCVTEDRWGRIYFGTARGIDRLDVETGRFKHYTAADGVLLSITEAAMQDRDGALWFASNTGLMRLVPEPDRSPQPPPILITRLSIAGEQQPISALGETEVASVELGPSRNQLQIDFVALGFSPGEGLKYQYKLEGTEQDWSTPSEQRGVNFANLAPGGYRFLVRGMNADGVISEAAAGVSFTVLPPVWQRWWFMSIAVVLVGLVAYGLYRYRVRRLMELERVRTRIASDLHDDIGAGLSRIAVLSEVARHEVGALPMNERLSDIARASRELIDSMSDIVWVINPERDQLRDLTQRMRRFASDVFTSRNIEFTFRAPDDEQHMKIGADIRRQVFLIFKESVNNVVRHSGCARAEIELNVEGSWFTLAVKDDGRGFDSESAHDGNGVANMRRRANMLGAQIRVDSADGLGTTVTLRVPLKATVKEHNGRLRGARP
jgi:ligand-binding sensor domain-containing protein/two-component sensor histidine kinase